MSTDEVKKHTQDIKDRINQWEDGLITGLEMYDSIESSLSKLDRQALQKEHDEALGDDM